MPHFSKRSNDKLETCHEDIVRVMRTVIQWYDFSIICGVRSEEAQTEAFESGFSTVQYPNSKHNATPPMLSNAIDIAPYPINWSDVRRFDILAGMVMMAADLLDVKLRWGGDWDSDDDVKDQKFNDVGHFELVAVSNN